jgi:hypothetical protein
MQAKSPHAQSPKCPRHLKSHLRFVAGLGMMEPAWSPLVNQSGRRTKLNIVAAGSIEHMSGGMTGEVNSPGTLSCLSGRWNT